MLCCMPGVESDGLEGRGSRKSICDSVSMGTLEKGVRILEHSGMRYGASILLSIRSHERYYKDFREVDIVLQAASGRRRRIKSFCCTVNAPEAGKA